MEPFPLGRGTNQLFKLTKIKEEEGPLLVELLFGWPASGRSPLRGGAVQGT